MSEEISNQGENGSDLIEKTVRGSYSKISDETRAQIIDAYDRGVDRQVICDAFSIKRQTLNSIIKVYEKENRINKKPKGGSMKLTSEERMKIKGWLDEDCTLTLSNIQKKLELEFNLKVSLSTIDRAIKSFHYTVKRRSLIPNRRNDPEVVELRYQYAMKYARMNLTKEKLFFIDEFGIEVWSRRSYGRSMVGTRANKRVKFVRSKNYSVCAAMNHESLFFSK